MVRAVIYNFVRNLTNNCLKDSSVDTPLTCGELAALKSVWLKEACSRSDIARLLGMSRPTASVIVKTLIDRGWLTEDGCLRSSGGKPAIQLKITPNSFHSVGIDIGYENTVRALLLDAEGNIIRRKEISASSTYSDRAGAVRQLVGILRTPETCGVGIAVSGTVDPQNSRIIHSANFELTGKPLAQEISESTDLPVYIDNRARMAARAEIFSGIAREVSDFLLVSLGKGIGSALSFSGNLYCGVSGKAGELRDIIVPDYSGTGVTTIENALSESMLEMQDYPCAKMAQICAAGFKQVLNIADLSVVILAGRFTLFPAAFRDELQKCLNGIDVRLAQFGRDSGACGSALAAVEQTIFNQNRFQIIRKGA